MTNLLIATRTYQANLALGHGEDERDYTAAAQMLLTLGAPRIRLLSNNPDKAIQLGALALLFTPSARAWLAGFSFRGRGEQAEGRA